MNSMLKRIVFVTTSSFFLLVTGYLVIFNQVSFFPRQMLQYLMILSVIIGLLSYVYLGYTKAKVTLAIRTAIHYVLLMGVLAVSLILFTAIPLWPMRIFLLWLLYTVVYAVFWIIIISIGLRSNKDLNQRLKDYHERNKQ